MGRRPYGDADLPDPRDVDVSARTVDAGDVATDVDVSGLPIYERLMPPIVGEHPARARELREVPARLDLAAGAATTSRCS